MLFLFLLNKNGESEFSVLFSISQKTKKSRKKDGSVAFCQSFPYPVTFENPQTLIQSAKGFT